METAMLNYADNAGRLIREAPSTFDELLVRLDSVGSTYHELYKMPFSVDLGRSGTGRLVVGVGDGKWLLMYVPENDEFEEPLYSLGDRNAKGTTKWFVGDASVIPQRYLIPRSLALVAIKSWFCDGIISDAVTWTNKIMLD